MYFVLYLIEHFEKVYSLRNCTGGSWLDERSGGLKIKMIGRQAFMGEISRIAKAQS